MNKILAAAILSAVFMMAHLIAALVVSSRQDDDSFRYLFTAILFEIIFVLIV